MYFMFPDTLKFDQVLPAWDTVRVTDMAGMFYGASDFNQALPAMDTGSVTDMAYMFYHALTFNQVLPTWDTRRASRFNQCYRHGTCPTRLPTLEVIHYNNYNA
jgi:hypothetical protein